MVEAKYIQVYATKLLNVYLVRTNCREYYLTFCCVFIFETAYLTLRFSTDRGQK